MDSAPPRPAPPSAAETLGGTPCASWTPSSPKGVCPRTGVNSSELPSGGLESVLALSLAGCPLNGEVLATVSDQPGWPALPGALEQLGDTWDLAHDRFAEAAIVTANPELQREVGRRLGRALLDGPDLSTRTVRLAGRLLTGAGDPDSAVCFRQWHPTDRPNQRKAFPGS